MMFFGSFTNVFFFEFETQKEQENIKDLKILEWWFRDLKQVLR